MDRSVKDEIIEVLDEMTDEQLQRVLDFTSTLPTFRSREESKARLMSLAGTISKEDGRQMMAAIDEACERT